MTYPTTPTVVFLLCNLGLSLIFCHAVWCFVRDTFARQDLFGIRDELWDRAFELNAFNDAAYRAARRKINAAICILHLINVALLIRTEIELKGRRRPLPENPKSDNPELQAAIDRALDATAARVRRYVFRDSLSMSLLGVAGIIRFSRRAREANAVNDNRAVRRFITSNIPAELRTAQQQMAVA